MRNYFQLARPDAGNQQVDFSPVVNALESYRQQNNQNALMTARREENEYQRSRDQRQDARADEQSRIQNLERLGKSAFAYSQLPPQQRDPATWGRMVKAMQGFDPSIGTDPDDMDPVAGPAKFAAVYGGQVRDPREDRLADIKLRTAEVELANAQRPKAPERVEVNGRIIERGPNGWQEVYAAPNAGQEKPPSGYEWDTARPGALRPIAGGPGEFKNFTEVQTKDAGFGARMLRAEDNLDKVLQFNPQTGTFAGYNPTVWTNAYAPDQSSWKNAWTANLINSKEWQQYIQGARESMAALLRKDTGAAVTDQEFDLYFPMYYPQPGDSPEVVAQKAEARKEIAAGLARSSGGAFERAYPERAEQLRQGSQQAPSQNVPRPQSAAERDALPPGTVYIAPDGQQRVKQ